MYIESYSQMSFIELYIEFEQSEVDQNIERKNYNSDSEEEFESNYEVVGPDGDKDQADGTMDADVTEVANALANRHPFEKPSFMHALDLEAMHAPVFSKYINADGEFTVRMEFSFREVVIIAMKDYTICKGVDYRVYKHIESNFLKKFKAPYLQKLIVNIGYSKTVLNCLRERGEAFTNWLNRIPREQYALVFDGGYRWGHMTTNLVECINSVLKGRAISL
ncbi:hypothetical protein Ahy_A06g029151 [Arachis hypogaea]|uniref:Transposase MuDR plant domain-containing protein n=1 Tax=Arachis hypogaea TaxID=3818 RepID=A0A445CSQ7_ARAHY|nr:hypothetical protein Ahy_A06g029151 [Arachis hypogaea]